MMMDGGERVADMPASIKRIDDCLSARDGRLFIEECDSLDLLHEFGSPLFVFSEDQLRRNVHRFRDAFQAGWPDGPVVVMPAAKANWLSAIQRILSDEGCGCDIYSPGELTVALNAGFDPARISVNGVPKDEDHVRRSIATGCRITIDSLEEVDIIEAAAAELGSGPNGSGRTAYVRLRLKPVLSNFLEHSDFVAEGLAPTDIAAVAYKGGLTFEQIMAVGPRLLKMKNVELVGFHQHHGRHKRSLRYWEAQMAAYAAEIGRVCRALDGYRPQEVDIGGGFAIPRDPFNAATNYSEPVQYAALHAISKAMSLFGPRSRYSVMARLVDTITGHPNRHAAPSIEAYARTCTSTLRRELPKHGIETRGLTLQLEPGRAMHGDTGVHLTMVKAIKRMATPIRWNVIVVDTTEFWFTGGRYEHHLHHYLFANKTDAAPTGKADIIGRSCYGDRLLGAVAVPDVQVGDLLALLDTGAYQEVSCSNFNAMPRPAAVLVTGDRAAVIRRRETEEDVFRRDVVPPHLL
jgi:diaminopimelate decarboxylase